MASIFLALVPLPTVFLAAAHGLEALKWRRVAGALVAVGGIVLIMNGGLGKGVAVPVLLVLMAIPVALAEGTVIIKLFRWPARCHERSGFFGWRLDAGCSVALDR